MAKLTKAQRRRRKQRRRMIRGAMEIAGLLLLALVCFLLWRGVSNARPAAPAATAAPTLQPTPEPTPTPAPTPIPTATPEPTPTPAPTPITITLTAVGDCTIGGDMRGSSEERFFNEVSDEDGLIDYDYCFKNVASIFGADDITLVNLEVVLTDSDDYLRREDKKYIMRGKPEYVNMLTGSSVEVCNIANNHMTDFGDAGIEETVALLEKNDLLYCGYGYSSVMDVKGVKVGFVGINYWTTREGDFKAQIETMREKADIVIVSIHWGTELEYYPEDRQQIWGKTAVDCGADLVVGHHPHVIEGMEEYNGVNIVYSLGNFCFGGNANPKDKDTFIYQHTFTLDPLTKEIIDTDYTVIPCKITSVEDDSRNNYQPTPIASKEDQKRLLEKIEYYSRKLKNPLNLTGEE